MIQYFKANPNNSNQRGIEAAHSSYQQLTIDASRVQSTLKAIQQAKELKNIGTQGFEGSVVKVLASNIVYPIAIDALNQIFSKCGQVIKISITDKS